MLYYVYKVNKPMSQNRKPAGGVRMQELYEAVLAKAKEAVAKETGTSLSAGTDKLISTTLKLYHATRRERETARDLLELPPIITAE